jgi:hypothetical protein
MTKSQNQFCTIPISKIGRLARYSLAHLSFPGPCGITSSSWRSWPSFLWQKNRISFIEQVLYPDLWESIFFLGAGPLLTSLVFLFGYPYPARFVFRFWRQKQKELRDIRMIIENESLLTLEQSKRIRRQIIEIQTDYDQQIRKLEDELERYKSALASKDKEIEELNEEFSNAMSAERGDAISSAEVSDSEIADAIKRRPYRLQFNPKKGRDGSKIIMFGPEGKILEGSNDNENSWRARNGRLELLNSDGKVFSRFKLDPPTNLFLHTNESDTLSIKGQYLVPEPSAAQ